MTFDQLYRRGRALSLVLGVILGGAVCASARADLVVYRVDPEATQVEFVALAIGVLPQRGKFAQVKGEIAIDRDTHSGRVDFEIDARSVDSGWDVRDGFLQGESMLDTEHHPEITYRANRLEFDGDRLKRIHGRLTLRGVARAVTLEVSQIECGAHEDAACEAQAVATLHRSEFGMESFAPLIADVVRLEFVVVARRER